MGDNDKPFICKHPNCDMTFSNEDHLNVHSKKHDMVLNLGLTKTNAIADQTPTPTRFIRNCEEVGLFQDLQNVNPFEETFRKAVENGSLHVPEANSEDTLHTPQIFHTVEKGTEKFDRDEDMPEDFSINLNSADGPKCKTEQNSPSKPIYTSVIFSSKLEIDLSSSNSEDTMTTDDGVSASSQEFSGEMVCKPTILREKLKEVLEKRKAEEDPLDIKETDKVPVRKRLDLKSKFTFLPMRPRMMNNDVNIYDKNVSEVDKKRMMNRMAQMRSRERKKLWMDHMEEEITRLKAENKLLVAENQKLKEENVNFKAVLLKHRNCSLGIDLEKKNTKPDQEKPKPAILKALAPKPIIPQIIPTIQVPCLETAIVDKVSTKTQQPVPKELPRLLPKPISSSVTTSVISAPPVRRKHKVATKSSSILSKPLTPISPSSMYITVNVPQAVVLQIKSPYNKDNK